MAVQADHVLFLAAGIFGVAPTRALTYDLMTRKDYVALANELGVSQYARDVFGVSNQAKAEKLAENLLGSAVSADVKTAATGALKGMLDANGGNVGAAGLEGILFLSRTSDANYTPAWTQLQNRVAVAQAYVDSANPATTFPLTSVTQDTASRDAVIANIKSIADTAPLTIGTDTLVANKFSAGLDYTPGGNDRVNTLQDEDTLVGTGVNPTLNATLGNANDNGATTIHPTLTGVQTVNVAFSGAGAAVNVLDLQDSTGIKSMNITRVAQSNGDVSIDNLTAVTDDLSLNNTSVNTNSVEFSFVAGAVSGAQDVTKITLNNANTRNLVIEQNTTAGNAFTGAANNMGVPTEGFETLNMVSSGSANTVGQLWAEDLQTLNISGDKNLTIGATGATVNVGTTVVEATRYNDGFGHVNGSLSAVNAAELTGNLDVTFGGELDAIKDNTSGVNMAVTVTGGKGNDIVRLNNDIVGTTDLIDGGEGNNTLVLVSNAQVNAAGTAAAPVATVKNVQSLEVRTGHDGAAVADVVTVNADAFDKLEKIFVRNEGQVQGVGGAWNSAAEGMTANLNNLTATQAAAITVAHGTTGNSDIANNVVNVTFKTAAADNAVQVTLVDGTNNDRAFNLDLNAVNAEKVTLVDSDSESNTVHLRDVARAQAGSTLTVLPGEGSDAGKYMNFDSFNAQSVNAGQNIGTANTTAAGVTVAGYGIQTNNTNGATVGDSTTVLAAIANARDTAVSTVLGSAAPASNATRLTFENIDASTYAGDVIVRVADVTRADGIKSQSIKTGTGNDTIIFDAQGVKNSGYTSADTVDAGTGTDTLVIDGNTTAVGVFGNVSVQKSEWDNTKGVDVLRVAGNEGYANNTTSLPGLTVVNSNVTSAGYYVEIDNEFVKQTDAGNNLTIINNDGNLTTNTESDLILNLRPLAQTSNVTFVGANANLAAAGPISSNRIQLEDNSANGYNSLDGGDSVTDEVGTAATRISSGNNNVLEVFNTADVSIDDLSKTKNFARIEATNDTAVAQTLKLVLNDTVMDQLVDAGTAARQGVAGVVDNIERLTVVTNANVNVANAVQNLNLNASQVSGKFALDVLASGTTNTILASAGADRVVLLGNYVDGTYAVNEYGVALNTASLGGNTAVAKVMTGTIDLGTGNDTLVTYGALNLAGVALNGVENLVVNSNLTLTQAQYNALGKITFEGTQTHTLTILDSTADTTAIDLSKIVDKTSGNITISNQAAEGAKVGSAITVDGSFATGTNTVTNVPVTPTNPTNPGAGANVTISGAGTHSATAQADTFKLADNPTASYEVTINGSFLYSADKILVPVGSTLPSAVAGGVNNATDGNVDLTWVDNGQIVTIHLVGVDAATEAGLQANAVSSTVFGTF